MAKRDVLESVQGEDYVEYFLFPKGISKDDSPENLNEALREIASLISCTVSEYKRDYIWHKDSFNISIREKAQENAENTEELPPHLYGISHFGDNIEDEWFIVYLLLQLTKDVKGLVVRVVDSDGEFILIEAAEHLPSWANPVTCKKRVFLYDGAIHMIPVPSSKKGVSQDQVIPSICSAIQMIHKSPKVTCAAQSIQNAIMARIKEYPEKIRANLHRATVYVPVGIAALLQHNSSLISPAVHSFCYRDPIDMRACRAMRYFPPENCVMTSVMFTRCLYAMISHHKFTPDRRTGWTLPPTSSKDYKAYDLGVKLACGFEILANQVKATGDRCNEETDGESKKNIETLLASRGWSMYFDQLKSRGYFKDLLEGSKDYCALLKNAQEFYVENCASVCYNTDKSYGGEVSSLLNKLDYDVEELKKASQNLPTPDDESWLEISSEELEKILVERYGPCGERSSKISASNPCDMTATLNSFLEHVSDLDGAEFPNRINARKVGNMERSPEACGPSDELTNSAMEGRLSFDPDSFSCAVQNILDFVIPDDSWDLESGSDESDMGSFEDESEMDLGHSEADKERTPETELKQYMDQMDRELASTTIADSFEKKSSKDNRKGKSKQGTSQEEDSFDDIEDFEPVDIDMNALKNILESYQSQLGGAGPASNLLGPMGVHLETLSAKPPESKDLK